MRFNVFIMTLTALTCGVFRVSPASAQAGSTYTRILGDVNDDGVITIIDALIVAQYSVGTPDVSFCEAKADVNDDNVVDILDALVIAQYSVGLVTEFDAGGVYDFVDPVVEEEAKSSLGINAAEPFNAWELKRLQALNVNCFETPGTTVTLEDIADMSRLRILSITNCDLQDLSGLSGLTKLTDLDLYNTQIGDVLPLANLTSLTSLDLSWNPLCDISALSNLTGLVYLDLGMTRVVNTKDNPGLLPISGLTALRYLNVSYNHVADLAPIETLTSLEELDLRGTSIFDIGPLADFTDLQTVKTGRTFVKCRPGGVIGDADGDGSITDRDVMAVQSLMQEKTIGYTLFEYNVSYWLMPSDNICCVDMDQDGLINDDDVNYIYAIAVGEASSPGICGVTCTPYSILGDADGDGEVTSEDADIIHLVAEEELPVDSGLCSPDDDCCLDMNGDQDITYEDETMARSLAEEADPVLTVVDAEAGEGVGILTYDHFVRSEPGQTIETDMDAIRARHSKLMSNPLWPKTDLIVPAEYSHYDTEYPIRLVDNGPRPFYIPEEAYSRYTLMDGYTNEVVEMIEELQIKAAENQTAVMVTVSEQSFYTNAESSYEMLWNTAVGIDKDGNINIRRRKHAEGGITPIENLPAGCEDIHDLGTQTVNEYNVATADGTFQVYTLRTRNDVTYDFVILICRQEDYQVYLDYMAGKHVDFLFQIDGQAMMIPGDESMKWSRYIPKEKPRTKILSDIYDRTELYKNFIDYSVYAGPFKYSQGVYRIYEDPPDPTVPAELNEPFPYISTERLEEDGYIYSRVYVR